MISRTFLYKILPLQIHYKLLMFMETWLVIYLPEISKIIMTLFPNYVKKRLLKSVKTTLLEKKLC